ncbi:hypothetical protein H5410_019759 [Solanum commersonii]|uniref:Uncharacterized protein n=1 Tax=Solanum commersonii TaxID=4109 RepID=A0A9J5ZC55_SOLCO|nr:hypothetical protein H5410_019759 [Solanum commersonii]
MEKGGNSSLEQRRRIRNLIDCLLNGMKQIKNEEEEFIASNREELEWLIMDLRFVRTFVLFGNTNLDEFYHRMSMKMYGVNELTRVLFYEDKLILAKYNMECLVTLLPEEMESYLSLENDYMTEYKILQQVCKHLRDFYPILGQQNNDISQCSSVITSLLIDIIPLELEVLYISTFKLMKESRSTELQVFVKQILKASPRILQNYLILLQRRMAGVVTVNYAPTQSINLMMEFLLIFLTDIPKSFIHSGRLNDMLAHIRVLTRKISILVSSENSINKADFSAPDFLQEIERMKGDIRQIFLKSPKSSQLRFPMDDGFFFINILLRHLNDLLISNAYSVSLIKNEIGMVKECLEFLRSSFGKVRQTLDDNVAYEAEHVINSILVRDKALKHLLFSLPKVSQINTQLEDKNGDHLLDAKSFVEPIESTSSPFVEVIVGHEKEESQIIDQLLDEHESKLDVISIVGMPGVGKTTLANKVYNNTLVASHFKIRAWCTISQKYNKSKVLQEILQQVTGSEEKGSEDDLADELRKALLNKRYLIVLDDVWDIATGEMLIACFPKFERGDRVILTSRISKVGSQVKCRTDPIELQVLTPEKSWELFEKRVFGEGSCPAELSDVGHQIVKKYKVIVRGKKKEKDLWLKIQHNLDSFISANINLVMQLSYDHLPYHLKPLLLYFARSQKNKRTPVSKLKQLWMAEGFVDHDIRSKSSLEDATQSYLDALISSSLIMVDHILSKKSMPFSVRIKVCYVHDVVHDFCSEKAKKAKFFKLMNSGARFHASDFLHHRLTIHSDNGHLHKRCALFNYNKCLAGSKHLIYLKVRGSLLKPRYICHTRPFGLVRVLQLDSMVLEDSLMEEIGSLFHLRFLRIWTRDVKAIPVSWLNLQNLETLIIKTRVSIIVLLPRILKLSKLKHVKIDFCSFFEEEEEMDAENIMHQPKLEHLTTLSTVVISDHEATNDVLEKLPNLQHLQCHIKELPTHGNWFPKLDVLNKLESLIAMYEDVRTYEYPELTDKIRQVPNEYYFPNSLKELRLYSFRLLRPDLLSAIAALPELEILEFWTVNSWRMSGTQTLSLLMVNLSEWQVDSETFPKLEELILKHCDQLWEIPCAFIDIETLKSIHLTNINPELADSAIEIKNEIAAYTGEDKLQVHISDMNE